MLWRKLTKCICLKINYVIIVKCQLDPPEKLCVCACACASVCVCWARDCAVSPLLLPNEWLHSLCQYFSDNISVNLFPSSRLSHSLSPLLYLSLSICAPFCLCMCVSIALSICYPSTWPWRLFLSFLAHCFVLCAIFYLYFVNFVQLFVPPSALLLSSILTQVDPAAVCVCVCAGQPVPTVNVITHKFWQLLWAIVVSFFLVLSLPASSSSASSSSTFLLVLLVSDGNGTVSGEFKFMGLSAFRLLIDNR